MQTRSTTPRRHPSKSRTGRRCLSPSDHTYIYWDLAFPCFLFSLLLFTSTRHCESRLSLRFSQPIKTPNSTATTVWTPPPPLQIPAPHCVATTGLPVLTQLLQGFLTRFPFSSHFIIAAQLGPERAITKAAVWLPLLEYSQPPRGFDTGLIWQSCISRVPRCLFLLGPLNWTSTYLESFTRGCTYTTSL